MLRFLFFHEFTCRGTVFEMLGTCWALVAPLGCPDRAMSVSPDRAVNVSLGRGLQGFRSNFGCIL